MAGLDSGLLNAPAGGKPGAGAAALRPAAAARRVQQAAPRIDFSIAVGSWRTRPDSPSFQAHRARRSCRSCRSPHRPTLPLLTVSPRSRRRSWLLDVFASLAALLLALGLGTATAQTPNPAVREVQSLLLRGDLAAALARTEAADVRDAELRFLRGVILMDLGRDADAMRSFASLAEDFPQLPDPWNNIALLHDRAGRTDLARLALETALRNDPAHRTARINLGHIHLKLAAQAWEQAALSAPLDSAVQQRLDAVRALLRTTSPDR